MSTQKKWFWAVGILVAGAALLQFGVPAQTLLIGGLLLLCPLMMFFMGDESKKDHPGASSHTAPDGTSKESK